MNALPQNFDGRAPYDVDPAWSPERKEAFSLYRDFGADRSLRAVAEVLKKSEGLINRWSMEDGWVFRVAAWDAEQDRLAQEAMTKERERISKKHARAIESTITVLMQPAVKLAQMIEDGDKSLADLDPITLANLSAQAGKQLPALVQASRLVHGFSTQNVDVNVGAHRRKIENATPESLDQMLLGIDDGAPDIEGTVREIEAGEQKGDDVP